MKTTFLYSLLFISTLVCAQKRIEQSFSNSDLTEIVIDSDQVFEIYLSTVPSDQITIASQIDGETYNSSLVKAESDANTLKVTTGRTPDFIPFNDKLSAHKVLSIVLYITIPEGLDVTVRSTLAQVEISGTYNKLRIGLGRGGLIGEDIRFRESVINTISGNVQLQLYEANVIAESRNGTTSVDPFFNQGPSCTIQSIHGAIEVRRVR